VRLWRRFCNKGSALILILKTFKRYLKNNFPLPLMFVSVIFFEMLCKVENPIAKPTEAIQGEHCYKKYSCISYLAIWFLQPMNY